MKRISLIAAVVGMLAAAPQLHAQAQQGGMKKADSTAAPKKAMTKPAGKAVAKGDAKADTKKPAAKKSAAKSAGKSDSGMAKPKKSGAMKKTATDSTKKKP